MHGSSFEQEPTNLSCPSLLPHPDYPEIAERIIAHERDIFGAPGVGVFDPVPSTRQSRLDGLLAVIGDFEQYREFADMPHDKFQRLKFRMQDKKKINGQSTTVGELLEGGDDALRTIYEAKVMENDPLAQALYEIRQHEPPLKEKAYEEFVDDAIIVFAKDALQQIIQEYGKRTVATDNQ